MRWEYSYQDLGTSPLKSQEIIFAYFLYWIVGPVLFLGPAIVVFEAVRIYTPLFSSPYAIFIIPLAVVVPSLLASAFLCVFLHDKWERGSYNPSVQEIIATLQAREAARGGSRLHPTVATRVPNVMQAPARSPLNELTPRELEVLALIAHGRPDAEIAAALVTSEGTVKLPVSNILMKLHLADRTQAAIFGLRLLVPLKEALEQEKHPGTEA